jgi:co-chaperonin GroES (HSP10)
MESLAKKMGIEMSVLKEAEAMVLPISNLHAPAPIPEPSKEFWDFEKEGGIEPPRVVGEHMALEVYWPKSTSGGIELAGMTQQISKFSSVVGKVIKLGSGAYKGERFQHWTDLPKVGDWVTFKPNSGDIFAFRGVPITIIYDDKVTSIIEKPEYVER